VIASGRQDRAPAAEESHGKFVVRIRPRQQTASLDGAVEVVERGEQRAFHVRDGLRLVLAGGAGAGEKPRRSRIRK
jgi:hypothetical protein